jgi:hypothetical protein
MAERHPSKHNYNPADGIVPDELTATKIAEIVLKQAHGDEIINRDSLFARRFGLTTYGLSAERGHTRTVPALAEE